MASKRNFVFVRSQPPRASLNSLNNGLQVHHQIHSIVFWKCISRFTRSRPRSTSPNSRDHGLEVHLYVHVIMVWYNSGALMVSEGILWESTDSGLRSAGSGSQDMKAYQAIRNHRNCVALGKFCKSAWNQQLGKIECVFCIMKCLSTVESPKHILPVAGTISIIPQSPYASACFPPANWMAVVGETQIVLLQRPQSTSLSFRNEHLQGVLRLCSSTVCI